MKLSAILIVAAAILNSSNAIKPITVDPAMYQQSPDCLTIWAWLPQIYPRGVTNCCEIQANLKESMPILLTCDANLRVTKINIGQTYNPASTLVRQNWKSTGAGVLNAPLPPYLGNLTELKTFIVGEAFMFGPLPKELSKLTKLEHFSVGNNGLSGEIPEGLFSDMVNLVSIDLSKNKFTGPVPDSFVNLPNLISVKLGQNKFSGPLPDFSPMTSVGKGPKYNVEDGGFDPVCDLNGLGPQVCIAKEGDLTKVPEVCVLPTPSPTVCVEKVVKSSPTPIYAEVVKPEAAGLSSAAKVAIGVSVGLVLVIAIYYVSFTFIRKGNEKDAADFEKRKVEKVDMSSD
ncbi:hypothetical protein HDU92_004504 [Lobulomyces angularis]|nr:hypothetical protein HDU92_004504 [Lobulomyces angularis]